MSSFAHTSTPGLLLAHLMSRQSLATWTDGSFP